MSRTACYGCSGCLRATVETKDGIRSKYFCESAQFYQEWAKNYYSEWEPDGIEAQIYANRLCDRYGIDTNCLSPMLLWMSMCHGAGVLNDKDTGIPISNLGSAEFIEALVKKIALREGFGNLLAKGTIRAAESLGGRAKELAKGYVGKAGPMVIYDPRMWFGFSLMYVMEPRNPMSQLHEVALPLYRWVDWANGIKTAFLSSDAFRGIAKRFWGSELAADFSIYEGKALAVKKIQDRQYVRDSLILCDIALSWPIAFRDSKDRVGDPTFDSKILAAVTGREFEEDELYGIGERIFNLQRAILCREGHKGRESDQLDNYFFKTPMETHPLNEKCLAPGEDGKVISKKGGTVDKEKFEVMKDEYYLLRGWDVATGLQTRASLEEIELRGVADDLEQRGLLGKDDL